MFVCEQCRSRAHRDILCSEHGPGAGEGGGHSGRFSDGEESKTTETAHGADTGEKTSLTMQCWSTKLNKAQFNYFLTIVVGLPLTTNFILINLSTNLSINQLIQTINFPPKNLQFYLRIFTVINLNEIQIPMKFIYIYTLYFLKYWHPLLMTGLTT